MDNVEDDLSTNDLLDPFSISQKEASIEDY